jgi:hypothetical protein
MSDPEGPVIWPITVDGPVPVDSDDLSEEQRHVLSLHGRAFYDFAEGDDKAFKRFADDLAKRGMDAGSVIPGLQLIVDPDQAYDLLVSGQMDDYDLYSRDR